MMVRTKIISRAWWQHLDRSFLFWFVAAEAGKVHCLDQITKLKDLFLSFFYLLWPILFPCLTWVRYHNFLDTRFFVTVFKVFNLLDDGCNDSFTRFYLLGSILYFFFLGNLFTVTAFWEAFLTFLLFGIHLRLLRGFFDIHLRILVSLWSIVSSLFGSNL